MQDPRDWYAWYGTGSKNRHGTILMADGSVKAVIDQSGDQFLNPGFSLSGTSGDDGYTNDNS